MPLNQQERKTLLGLTGILSAVALSGCFVSQLTPTSHVVTIEPNGSRVDAECVPATQLALTSMRVECKEHGTQFVQECSWKGCTYTRNGKVFRECTPTSRGVFSYDGDCIENGIHVSRKCDRGLTTVTCTETVQP
jgi:hypothetical protein